MSSGGCSPSVTTQAEITNVQNEIQAYLAAIQAYQTNYSNWVNTVHQAWVTKQTNYSAGLPAQNAALQKGHTAQSGYIWSQSGDYIPCSSITLTSAPFNLCGYYPWETRACAALGYNLSGGQSCNCDVCSAQQCCSSDFSAAVTNPNASWYQNQYNAWITANTPGPEPICPYTPPTSANFSLGICLQCVNISDINAQTVNVNNVSQQLNSCVAAAQSNLAAEKSAAATTPAPAPTPISTPAPTATPVPTSSFSLYMIYFLVFIIFIVLIAIIVILAIQPDEEAPRLINQ